MNNIEENHVILVDIGNTRIKYSLLCHAEEEPNACEDANSLFSFIDSQKKISHLYIASVRNQELVDEISAMCNERKYYFCRKAHRERSLRHKKIVTRMFKKWALIDGSPWSVLQKSQKKHFLLWM